MVPGSTATSVLTKTHSETSIVNILILIKRQLLIPTERTSVNSVEIIDADSEDEVDINETLAITDERYR